MPPAGSRHADPFGRVAKLLSTSLARGVQITELAHFLGHRDINVTHQVYGHLLPSAAKRAVAALEGEFAEWSES
jgi:integrase